MKQDFFVDIDKFDLLTLILEFDFLFENINLANNFWTLSALIIHLSILCDKAFPWIPPVLFDFFETPCL